MALQFALHAIDLRVPKICLLLRSLWTEGATRRDKLFLPHPPARIYQISERLPFMHRQGFEGRQAKELYSAILVVRLGRRPHWGNRLAVAPVKPTRVVIDIETRSTLDLKKVGANVYANDPTTSITHIGFANGAGAQIWRPSIEPIPNVLADALADERITLTAHNAGFERTVLSGPAALTLGLPDTLGALERWDCTAARAAHVGLPRDLASACKALRLPDSEG